MEFDWSVIGEAMPALLSGARLTILITIAGLVGGLIVGFVAGLMRAYGNAVLNAIAFLYIELIRGTPIVVQVMFIYFALPVLADIRVNPMTAAVTAIVVNAGAYIAEIVRGSFLSVHKGLKEAGLALGLPLWKVLVYIIGPVAFRRMIPPLGNQFIVSLKDTSLFIVIGVGELTRQGQEIMAANFRAVEIWSAVAILYLLMTGTLTLILRVTEKRMRIPMSIVEFRNVTKTFGSVVVLREVDLNIDKGEVVVLIGPSGSGKSTLLRCINALEEINGGDLVVDDISVKAGRSQVRMIRQEAGMVFQQFNLFPQMTALENVAFGPRRVRGVSRAEALEQAKALLAKVGLAERGHHYPSELSGGQQQRVAIARALAVKPKLMLFDEPTSALDPELRHEVLRVMQALAEEGMTMIVVTHEMAFARQVGTRLIFMEDGKISVDGNPVALLANPENPRLREFLQHVQ